VSTDTQGGRVLVEPERVPAQLRTRLKRAGLTTTTKVHEAIEDGTLLTLEGIGGATASKIRALYTAARPGSGWGGPRANSGRRSVGTVKLEAKITEDQDRTLQALQRSMAGASGGRLSRAEVVRRLLDQAATE